MASGGVGLQRVVVSEVGMTASGDAGGAGQGPLEAGQAGGSQARKRRRVGHVRHRVRHRGRYRARIRARPRLLLHQVVRARKRICNAFILICFRPPRIISEN